MAGAVNAYENAILDHLFGAAALSVPADWHVGLFTTTPADDGTGGTEVSGGAYARVAVTRNATNFPAASGGAMANGTVIQFATPTAAWGNVKSVGLWDAASAGNLRFFTVLTTAKDINIGDDVEFAVGDLDITLD